MLTVCYDVILCVTIRSSYSLLVFSVGVTYGGVQCVCYVCGMIPFDIACVVIRCAFVFNVARGISRHCVMICRCLVSAFLSMCDVG